MEAKINELMSKMSLEDKLGQLNLMDYGAIMTGTREGPGLLSKLEKGAVGAVLNAVTKEQIKECQDLAMKSKLKIPLIFGLDIIHGYKTIFPIPLGLSCSWNPELIEKAVRISAEECSSAGINWAFSPMVDIARDPRWGRIAEGAGEDVFLGSEVARAFVRGFQGKNKNEIPADRVMACVKHFALYGAAEAGLDYNMVDMSRNRMYNEYLGTYKAAVDEGAGSVMTSFNEVDGIPATANKFLFTDLLRDQWKWNGFVVSDYTAILEMVDHGMGDLSNCAKLAMNAGVDMDMCANGFLSHLKPHIDSKAVPMSQIDKAVRRILEAKYKLGLFADPYRYLNRDPKKELYKKENMDFARKVSAETIVLLKNEGNLLPLKKDQKVCVIGPLVSNKKENCGCWAPSADLDHFKSILEGFKNFLGHDVPYARGSNVFYDPVLEKNASCTPFGDKYAPRDSRSDKEMLDEALALATKHDIVIAALGEPADLSGESSSRADITIPDAQRDLLRELVKTGKKIVLLLFTGRPLAIQWEKENCNAILAAWWGGSMFHDAICDVLYGNVNPSAKLTTTWPKNLGQVPLYYNRKVSGRPAKDFGAPFEKFKLNYIDCDNYPCFPFGFGLSYTTFEYGEVKLSSNKMKKGSTIKASVQIKNTGKIDGDEIVQLYIRDIVGSTTRPVKELKGFQRVHVKAGASANVEFTIGEDLLKFYNSELKYVAEPGEFGVIIAPHSGFCPTEYKVFVLE